jgi:hypothetical protein
MPPAEHAQPFVVRHILRGMNPSATWTRTLGGGVAAGEIAGLAMAVSMAAAFQFAMSRSPFLPFQAIGATLLGYADGAPPSYGLRGALGLAGFAVHMVVPSLFWGLVFGGVVLATRPSRAWRLLLLGLGTGAVAQIVDVHILMPILDANHILVDRWTVTVHPVWSWLFHLAFGVGVSLHPWTYDAELGHFA